MHNRTGARIESRDISLPEGLVLAPLVLLILAIALYPQFGLKRSEKTVSAVTAPVAARNDGVASGWTHYAPLKETP
jgi:NADH:ubiquinone oxidoreductase subunit 4 (subunit M)